MKSWSRLFREHRTLAAFFVVLALCVKALVPAGHTVSASPRLITVEVCGAATSGAEQKLQLVIPMEDEQPDKRLMSDGADATCAWSALSMAGLAGAEPGLIAGSWAFGQIAGIWPQASVPIGRTRNLRPPLRGPPLNG